MSLSRGPGVVRVHSFNLALVYAGSTLEALQNQWPDKEVPKHEALACWWAQATASLAYIHEKQFVHGDISLKNICQDFQIPCSCPANHGTITVIDFGSSDTIPCSRKHVQRTWPFQDPSVLSLKSYDAEADIYSLVVTFIALATESAPFQDLLKENPTPKQLANHLRKSPNSPDNPLPVVFKGVTFPEVFLNLTSSTARHKRPGNVSLISSKAFEMLIPKERSGKGATRGTRRPKY